MHTPSKLLHGLPLLALCFLVSAGNVPAPADAAAKGFDKKLSLQGITFRVQCPNHGSLNKLTITPAGLTGANTPVVVEVDGTITGAEVGDLDANGSPEVYVYVTSAGSGSYGSLVAYAANNRKSITPIYLPDLMEDKINSKGYMGHDRFALMENTLVRRFPLYHKGDSNSKPTGKTRQLQYKLKAGEAGWVLRWQKTVDS